jgi:hypothetical protein
MRAAALCFLVLAACAPPEWVRANAGAEVTFDAVHGTGPNDIWVVGDLGTIAHFNGMLWSLAPPLTSVHLRAVAAASATDVWAFGDSGVALHFNGAAWTRVDLGTDKHLVAAVSLGAKDLWVMPKDVHYLLHYDGTSWTQVDATTREGYGQCLGGNSANSLWLMPSSTSYAYLVTPSGVAEIALELSGEFDCKSISSQSTVDAWFLETDRLLHFDGRLFRPTTPPKQAGLYSYDAFYGRAVFAAAPSEAWVVGNGGGVYHVSGDVWTQSNPFTYDGLNLNAVWGSRTNDLWAVGASGMVERHAPATVTP